MMPLTGTEQLPGFATALSAVTVVAVVGKLFPVAFVKGVDVALTLQPAPVPVVSLTVNTPVVVTVGPGIARVDDGKLSVGFALRLS